jgi:hypothetical protein
MEFGLNRIETSPAGRKHEENAEPNRSSWNPWLLSAILDGFDSLTKIEDFLYIATKP